jgi:BarA-like signal transduction histidine kinase
MSKAVPFVDYYKNNNISPVSQNISDLKKHYQRREALYRQLGFLKESFMEKKIIEFGPGSGHNSLYTASLQTQKYVLVDGNPVGLERCRELLKDTDSNLTFHNSLIEDYTDQDKYDFVICEGTLPMQHDPAMMLKTLSSFANQTGKIIITCVDSVSVLSDMLRRYACKVLLKNQSDRSLLVPFLETQFLNLKGMSRPINDWIDDCVFQPFQGSLFSIKDATLTLNSEFEIYQSSPNFLTDWRWYKDIHGDQSYNQRVIEQYLSQLHNFIDYRFVMPAGDMEVNKQLLSICDTIVKDILTEDTSLQARQRIISSITKILGLNCNFHEHTQLALKDYCQLISSENMSQEIKTNNFRYFFGRGQQYVSFRKN